MKYKPGARRVNMWHMGIVAVRDRFRTGFASAPATSSARRARGRTVSAMQRSQSGSKRDEGRRQSGQAHGIDQRRGGVRSSDWTWRARRRTETVRTEAWWRHLFDDSINRELTLYLQLGELNVENWLSEFVNLFERGVDATALQLAEEAGDVGNWEVGSNSASNIID